MDLSKLSDDQLKIALKVIDSAEKHGVNPDFVLPMVMVESGFKQDIKSPRGAIGVMQLMPDTAKGLNVNPNDLDENIDGGMRLLKELSSDKRIGGDPYKILVAYNTSTETRNKFLDGQNMADLPDETIKHVNKVLDNYGKEDLPHALVTEKVEEAPAETPKPAESENIYSDDTLPEWNATQEQQEQSRLTAGAVGAGAGTLAGSIYAAKAPIVRMAQRVGVLPGGKPITPGEAAQLAEKVMTPTTPPPSVVRKPHGGENWQKSLTGISTPGAQMSKESLDLAKGMQSAVGIRGEPGFVGGTITEGGVILSPRDVAAVQAKQAATPIPRVRQPGLVSTAASKVLGSSPVKGGLVGLNIGYSAQDVANSIRNQDTTGAVIGGAGLTGDVMSLAPVATKIGARVAPLGGALSASADAARRARSNDYVGALTSAIGAAGPYVAPWALGPEVGIPVGIGLALGSPLANELKDYIQRKMAGE